MTTENPNPVNVVPEGRANEDSQHQEIPANTQPTETRPPSGLFTSTEATEESLSTYAERTVEAIIARDTPGIASLLPPLTQKQEKAEQAKVSVSEEVFITPRAATSIIPRDGAGNATTTHIDGCGVGEISRSSKRRTLDPDKYFTDTTDVEDLLDSSGVGGPVTPQAKSTPTLIKVPRPRTDSTSCDESNEDLPGTSQGREHPPRQLSASGRTLLRKHFASKDPIVLPRSKPVIALTEGQIHTVLKTMSDETILSSFQLMKSLLLQATSGNVLSKERCRHMSSFTASGKQEPSSSEYETTDIDSPNEGYTSGAINTDNEPGSLSFCIDDKEAGPSANMVPEVLNTDKEALLEVPLSPGSGYSLGYYAPLSSLRATSTSKSASKGPPRKRRRLAGRPGKVMKEAYFKGIRWTKIFLTGPLDPAHNHYKFYCRICKSNVSIYSKGAREIIRHYQSESHLRKDQLWRFTYLKKVNEITKVVTHQVRGRNGLLLTPLEMEKEKPFLRKCLVGRHRGRVPLLRGIPCSSRRETNHWRL